MSAGKARRLFLTATILSTVVSLVLSSQQLLAGAGCSILAAMFLSTRRLIGSLSGAEADDWLWGYTTVGVAAGVFTIIGWQGYSSAALYWIAATMCLCTAFFGNYLDRYLRYLTKMNAQVEAKASTDDDDSLPITRDDLRKEVDSAVVRIGEIVVAKRKKKKDKVAAP